MSFELIPERVAKLWQDRKLVPTFRWGVVTAINPVRVRFDGDADAFAGSPSSLVAGLVVGDRVHCLHYFRKVTIMGVGRGADNPRRFPSKAQLDLWPAPDGTHAWAGAVEFVRVAGVWRRLFIETPWLNMSLESGFSGSARYRIVGDTVRVEWRVDTVIAAGALHQDFFILPVGARPSQNVAAVVLSQNAFMFSGTVGTLGRPLVRNNSSSSQNWHSGWCEYPL